MRALELGKGAGPGDSWCPPTWFDGCLRPFSVLCCCCCCVVVVVLMVPAVTSFEDTQLGKRRMFSLLWCVCARVCVRVCVCGGCICRPVYSSVCSSVCLFVCLFSRSLDYLTDWQRRQTSSASRTLPLPLLAAAWRTRNSLNEFRIGNNNA